MTSLLILNIGLQEWTETRKIHWPMLLQYFYTDILKLYAKC
jgi:hypothetical protein